MRSLNTHDLLTADFRANTASKDPYEAFLDSVDISGQLTGRPRLHQSMYLWTKLIFPSVMLGPLGDRSEMGHSIEGRLPMLDTDLVEFARQLPIDSKICGTTEKYVLREAVRPFVTNQVYGRRKHPFVTPSAFTHRTRAMAKDILCSEALRALPFFDVAAVQRSLNVTENPAVRRAPSAGLQAAVCLAILQEHYRVAA